MKKAFLNAIFIYNFFAVSLSFAQSGWIWHNPQPYGNSVYTLKFASENVVYAANGKSLLKSTDGGYLWKDVYVFPMSDTINYNIISINAFDELNVYISYEVQNPISQTRIFYLKKTSDGGLNWSQEIPSPYQNSFTNYFIYFVNQSTGYGINMPYLFKTTNAGLNFYQISINSVSEFSSVFFLNENTGWAGKQTSSQNTSQIFKTTNGGQNWISAVIPGDIIFNSIHFLDANTGYMLTGPGIQVYKSTNGGENWISQGNVPQSANLIKFINSTTGTALGLDGAIYLSTNSGANWQIKSRDNYFSAYATCLDFINENTGIAMGGFGVLFKTINKGLTWTKYWGSKFNEKEFRDVSFASENTGWISGAQSLLKSTDAGNNWLNLDSINSYNAARFVNIFEGVVCSENSFFANTTNGGISWIKHYFEGYNFKSAEIASGSFWYVYGENSSSPFSIFYSTTNSGTNWYQKNFPQGIGYNFSFSNYETGWAINESGLYKTTNASQSWILINQTKGNFIKFISDNTGFIIADSIILKTTNGGLSWIEKYKNKLCRLKSLTFINDSKGYAVGNGRILKTTNGGETWILNSGLTLPDLNSCSFQNINTGYIVGKSSAILKTAENLTNISGNYLEIPDNYSLSQNYPNPFNPSTKINYELKITNYVSLKVFDLLGKEVASLVNEKQSAGSYAVDFNSAEYNLPSGIYFYTFSTGDFKETRKMVLIK